MNSRVVLVLTFAFLLNSVAAQLDGYQINYDISQKVEGQWEKTGSANLIIQYPDAWFATDDYPENSLWISQKNYEIRSLLEFEGERIALSLMRNEKSALKIDWTGESKKILGFDCQELNVSWPDFEINAWIYQKTSFSYIPYLSKPGIALEYTIKISDSQKHFEAKRLNKLKADLSAQPQLSDHKRMEQNEFSEMMTKRMMPNLQSSIPDFEHIDFQGNLFKMREQYGKLLVINFWYTKCVPCIKEIPVLNVLKEKYNEQPVQFLAITFDSNELVEKFLNLHPYHFRILTDAQALLDIFTVRAFPTTILVDQSGNIIKSFLGGDKNTLEELDNLIMQKIK